MIIKLSGGTVYDPANGINGKRQDIRVRQVIRPGEETRVIDLAGQLLKINRLGDKILTSNGAATGLDTLA